MNPDERQQLVQEIQKSIDGRGSVLENYRRIQTRYRTGYGWLELDPLRDEICMCITFGLCQAAIVLTNVLLESLLKYALIYSHARAEKSPKPSKNTAQQLLDWPADGIRLYADKNLGYTINRACTLGLLTKDQKKQLHQFRDKFRNAYAHADKTKLFGDAKVPIAVGQFGQANMTATDAKLRELPFVQGLAQAMHAQKHATPYFEYVDDLVREVNAKMYPKS